jgi:anti-sigma factor RsiW
MNRLPVHHPEEGELLRYIDGELARSEAGVVRAHLQACWECRAQVEELQSVIGECVRYRKNMLAPMLPLAPQTWKPLDFESAEAELAGESLVARWARWASPRRNRPLGWALSGAAAVALSILLMNQLRETPKVEAAALLKKAVAISQSRPAATRRVRITTRSRQITRTIGVQAIGDRRAVAGESEVAALFAAAHYDWNDPLSAQAYANWRGSLTHYADAVASQANSYEITTTTTESELASATLKLRGTDLEPLQGRLEFRNRDWVEMTELVDQQTPPASSISAGTTGGTRRQPGAPPALIEAPAAETTSPSPFSEELMVVSALHQAGADLGDPVAIAREGKYVLVTGTGIAPLRQQQLHGLLDRLPHVVVRFSDPVLPTNEAFPTKDFPASKRPVQSEPVARDAAGSETSPYTARIEERLGGRPQFERFSGQVLEWTDSAMTRAYALRRLAQQFSTASEAAMSPEDRRTLHALGREHLAALSKDYGRIVSIVSTVSPVLNGFGAGTVGKQAPGEWTTWQPASEELLISARRVETLLAQVLGAGSGERAAENPPAQLAAAMAQLSGRIEQCQRLLGER